jgi:hypothetical protein
VFSELSFIPCAGNNVNKTEEQYRQMPFVDWKEEAPFKKDGFLVDTGQFWIGVLQHKAFKKLVTCLTTPVSNALVERIFSLVSSIKMNTRNRIQRNLLDCQGRPLAFKHMLQRLHCVSRNAKKNFTPDKVYTVCSTHSSGEDSDDMDLELFI